MSSFCLFPHFSHWLTVYLLFISSFLAFIFQTSFLLFGLLTLISFITDPPYVSLCHLESEWQKYFGRLFSLFCYIYIYESHGIVLGKSTSQNPFCFVFSSA